MNLKCGYFTVGGIMCGSLVGIFVGALAVNASLGYMILLLGAWGLCLLRTAADAGKGGYLWPGADATLIKSEKFTLSAALWAW